MHTLSDLFRNFFQVGYVAEDLDAAVEYFESKLGTVRCAVTRGITVRGSGVEPDDRPEVPWISVRGEPAEEWVIDLMLVNAGSTNLEVIRPVGGAVDLYREAIRPGAPVTFHHLGFRVNDFDQARAVVERNGRSWEQLCHGPDLRMGYLDLTAEMGMYVELIELNEASAARFTALQTASDEAQADRRAGEDPDGR